MYEKLTNSSDAAFKRFAGIKRQTFAVLMKLLQEAEDIGEPVNYNKGLISLEDQLLLWLSYMKENLSSLRLSLDYKIPEKSVHLVIKWVEIVLSKNNNLTVSKQPVPKEGKVLMTIDLDNKNAPATSISKYFNKFRALKLFRGSQFELKLRLIAKLYNLEIDFEDEKEIKKDNNSNFNHIIKR